MASQGVAIYEGCNTVRGIVLFDRSGGIGRKEKNNNMILWVARLHLSFENSPSFKNIHLVIKNGDLSNCWSGGDNKKSKVSGG